MCVISMTHNKNKYLILKQKFRFQNVIGKRIYLRLLAPGNVSCNYVNWMNDSEVRQFLESRFKKYTLKDIKQYVRAVDKSPYSFLFGIFLLESNQHIGNIKIGGIDSYHKFADIGLLIGERKMWGLGYGAEAIALATNFGFKVLGLKKIAAGIYANNVGSYKAFLKNKYKLTGRMRLHRRYKNKYVDEIIVEKLITYEK